MHHLAKIAFGKLTNRPYHAECACGTAGDFGGNEEARLFLGNHLARLQGINSAEFVDETVTPLPVPQEAPSVQTPATNGGKETPKTVKGAPMGAKK